MGLTVLLISLLKAIRIKIKPYKNRRLVSSQIVQFILSNKPRIKMRRLKIKAYLNSNKMWENLILVNKIK